MKDLYHERYISSMCYKKKYNGQSSIRIIKIHQLIGCISNKHITGVVSGYLNVVINILQPIADIIRSRTNARMQLRYYSIVK